MAVTVNVQNNSGRALDNIIVWHFPSAPPANDSFLTPERACIAQPLAAGATASGQTTVVEFSPMDYWVAQITYSGDGQPYVITGTSYEPYKEYEVSDNTTITFDLAAYTSGTTDQTDCSIYYSAADTSPDSSAHVMNPTMAEVAAFGFDILEHIVTEGAD